MSHRGALTVRPYVSMYVNCCRAKTGFNLELTTTTGIRIPIVRRRTAATYFFLSLRRYGFGSLGIQSVVRVQLPPLYFQTPLSEL